MAYFRDTATGAAALSKTTVALPECQIVTVRMHLGAASATAENIVVSIDSALGAAWDVEIDAVDMNTKTDYEYAPSLPIPIFAGDKIKVAWANTNTETYGLEIIWQK